MSEDYGRCVGKDAKECRKEIADSLEEKCTVLLNRIHTEILSYHPVGRLSELGEALCISGQSVGQPPNTVCTTTPIGTYVFRKTASPDRRHVDRWYSDWRESEKIGEEVAEIHTIALEPMIDRFTGNFRVVEQGRKFKQKGLLTSDEIKTLTVLEKFWESHPDLDKVKDGGFWRSTTQIEPWRASAKLRRFPKQV
jgi:hypothetical protein